MKVVATPKVGQVVRARGGRLCVWSDHQRCCQGATYLLTSSEPGPRRRFRPVEGVDGFELWFDPGNVAPADELYLDVKGRRTKRVEAYWNGCVFVT